MWTLCDVMQVSAASSTADDGKVKEKLVFFLRLLSATPTAMFFYYFEEFFRKTAQHLLIPRATHHFQKNWYSHCDAEQIFFLKLLSISNRSNRWFRHQWAQTTAGTIRDWEKIQKSNYNHENSTKGRHRRQSSSHPSCDRTYQISTLLRMFREWLCCNANRKPRIVGACTHIPVPDENRIETRNHLIHSWHILLLLLSWNRVRCAFNGKCCCERDGTEKNTRKHRANKKKKNTT